MISHFCGKLVQEKFLSRKRKDPRNPASYHPVCDVCHEAYIDKRELEPYLATVSKMQRAGAIRQTDKDLLNGVLDEVTDRYSKSARQSTTDEEEVKAARYESQMTQLTTEVNQLTKDIQVLSAREREIDQHLLKFDKEFEAKFKQVNGL